MFKDRPAGFLVLSGDDGLTLPLMAAGCDGVISVVANAYPKEFSEMVRQGLDGNFAKARELHYKLIDIINALFADGSPAGIKAALSMKKLCGENLRLPLVAVSKDVHSMIKKIMDQTEK